MWIVAGVLLGSVLLSSLLGFHTGPHSHAAAGILGTITALWLVGMALDGRSSSVLWTLFSADVVVSAGVGVIAWKGLSTRSVRPSSAIGANIAGKEGVAVSALDPNGIVRVRGENWSATSLNGPIAAGSRIQVISVSGITLEVWGDAALNGTSTSPRVSGDVAITQPDARPGDAEKTRGSS